MIHAPLDPECPDNPLPDFFGDPITAEYGIGEEMAPLIEGGHRKKCNRCQAYGVENIEVEISLNGTS